MALTSWENYFWLRKQKRWIVFFNLWNIWLEKPINGYLGISLQKSRIMILAPCLKMCSKCLKIAASFLNEIGFQLCNSSTFSHAGARLPWMFPPGVWLIREKPWLWHIQCHCNFLLLPQDHPDACLLRWLFLSVWAQQFSGLFCWVSLSCSSAGSESCNTAHCSPHQGEGALQISSQPSLSMS